jgi:hypothetical protein
MRLVLLVVLCTVSVPAWASDHDEAWTALRQRSLEALASLSPSSAEFVPDGDDANRPSVVVVGFTGGLERRDSRVSGVVRLRRAIAAASGASPDVVVATYSNFHWRRAATDVRRQVVTGASQASRPLVLVYGHSWGAGAITKFARALAAHDIEVTLAVYVDAFTLRQPRVPGNVRYAVNLYQRTGILRGLPLRGKKTLRAEDPAFTTVLGSLRVTPRTEHFGWNWNLVQPLLYRQHHRIGHDVRLRDYLVTLVDCARQVTRRGDRDIAPALEAGEAACQA